MGAAGAWDPWETHYGEVARQMVLRSDPLDLWWQPGNSGPDARAETYFASKPALPFWVWALSFEVFRVGMQSDPFEMLHRPWPELALRVPVMLASFAAVFALARTIWFRVSPRAGLLTALVLLTMPQWAMLGRQALTDIFFVAPVVLAAVAWTQAWMQADRPLARRRWSWIDLPWDRAYWVFWGVFAVGAIVPLAVLHHHSFDPTTWAMFGKSASKAKGLHEIQRHFVVYWVAAVAFALRSTRWRTRRDAWMGILYVAAGLSMMGKGMIGPGLIGAVVLADLAISGQWRRLGGCKLGGGLVLFALTCFPWHHAMILYRGDPWTNELLVQNNLQRFSTGEQAQAVGGVSFYIETLGLAALPWSALLPLAIVRAVTVFRGASNDAAHATSDSTATQRFMLVWFAVSLFVVTFSTTKYYHYLAPCLPPLAAVLGIVLDRWWAVGRTDRASMGLWVAFAWIVGVALDLVHEPSWLAHLTTYLYTGMWTQGAPDTHRIVIVVAPFVIGLCLMGFRRARAAIVAWSISGVLTTGYVLADYIPATSESWSQRSAFEVYTKERGPRDRLVAWWFYYRGETFFSKANLWVLKGPDRAPLAELLEANDGKDMSIWFITVEAHAKRLHTQVPLRFAERIEERYRSFHYVLMRVRMGTPDAEEAADSAKGEGD